MSDWCKTEEGGEGEGGGGGGGRGRGRECRDAPRTLTRKGPGCGPPIASGTEWQSFRDQEDDVTVRAVGLEISDVLQKATEPYL